MIKDLKIFLIIFLSVSLGAGSAIYAQQKDFNAFLQMYPHDVVINDDGSIWISSGSHYLGYAKEFGSKFHYSRVGLTDQEEQYDKPDLDHIRFFNNDTGYVVGYIGDGENNSQKSGYFYTIDGGENWIRKSMKYSQWVYDTYALPSGHAWCGGSNGKIMYTDNFAFDWKEINTPFTDNQRLYRIFMKDTLNGIAGANSNKVYVTEDNWKNFRSIESPLDQNLFPKSNTEADYRITKVAVWKNYYILKQNEVLFYTDQEVIEWKRFPEDIFGFTLDSDEQKLYGISNGSDVFCFNEPEDYNLMDIPLSFPSYHIVKHKNDLYFIASKELGKFDGKDFHHCKLYTSDHKISQPDPVYRHHYTYYGTKGSYLYASERDTSSWYRIGKFPDYIYHLNFLNDTSIIGTSLKGMNYYMNLKNGKAEKYHYEKPIEEFLSSQVQKVIIESGSNFCLGGSNKEELHFTRSGDKLILDTLGTTNAYKSKNLSFSANELSKILTDINVNPYSVPDFNSFKINQSDKEYYNTTSDSLKSFGYDIDLWLAEHNYIDQGVNIIDTISAELFTKIFTKPYNSFSTTSYYFSVTVITETDTLEFYHRFFNNPKPYYLRWQLQYQDKYLNNYNLELSKFISKALPEEFLHGQYFNNHYLIFYYSYYFSKYPDRKF